MTVPSLSFPRRSLSSSLSLVFERPHRLWHSRFRIDDGHVIRVGGALEPIELANYPIRAPSP
jgi:hypothetical protein